MQSPVIQGQSYEVEKILNDYTDDQGNWYLVKWKRYSDDHNSWIPESNFDDPAPIRAYNKNKSALQMKERHTTKKRKTK
jgi:hypothetical protein